MKYLLWGTVFLTLLANVVGYHILMMFTFGSKSHKYAMDPVAEELVKRGHQVTIMSPIQTLKDPPGVKNVYLSKVAEQVESLNFSFFQSQHGTDLGFLIGVFEISQILCTTTYFEEPEIKTLIKDPASAKYDVLIIDAVMNEWLLALGPHLGIPTIALSPSLKFLSTAWAMNIPVPYSYVASGIDFITGDMTFYQRFQNLKINVAFLIARYYYMFLECDKIIQKAIPDSPPLAELEGKIAFLLTNSHTSVHPSVPQMPYYKEVGCLHCKAAKPLPMDLEEFMQSSGEAGVIYFSLGSHTKGSSMPPEMRDKAVKAFGQLPQKILWKYENDIEGLPQNIKLTKWVPQQDVLAHNKTRLFITHGGGLSTFEAAYHSCPILGFPLSHDQWGNMGLAVGKGFAESLNWRTFTEEEFLDKIQLMLTDSRYQTNVDRVSALLKDRPQEPLEVAAYWIEYVTRHKGAPHLKSAAERLNLFQYLLLDVISLLLLAALVVLLVVGFTLRKLYRICFAHMAEVTKKIKKSKKNKVKKH